LNSVDFSQGKPRQKGCPEKKRLKFLGEKKVPFEEKKKLREIDVQKAWLKEKRIKGPKGLRKPTRHIVRRRVLSIRFQQREGSQKKKKSSECTVSGGNIHSARGGDRELKKKRSQLALHAEEQFAAYNGEGTGKDSVRDQGAKEKRLFPLGSEQRQRRGRLQSITCLA